MRSRTARQRPSYTGGTEPRGQQNVNGGHNLMAKATVKAIALKLGNVIAMPVRPYTPKRSVCPNGRRGARAAWASSS